MADVVVAINVQSSEPDTDVVGIRVILPGDPFSPVPSDQDLIDFAESLDWEPLFGSDYASTLTTLQGLTIEGLGHAITLP